MKRRARRTRIRLDPAAYCVPGSVWHVTTNIINRQPVFADPEMAEIVIESIRFQCFKSYANLLVYCVMPDHVHLAVVVGERGLGSILHDFKSYTGHIWAKRTGHKHLWQESFHDHGVRRSERMDELVFYIVDNARKSGLVDDWRDYPWIGGSLIEEEPVDPEESQT